MARPAMFCPKCREHRRMTLHHIYPVRFFGRKGNTLTFLLCRKCHDRLEDLIPQTKKLDEERYVRILLRFLENTTPP